MNEKDEISATSNGHELQKCIASLQPPRRCAMQQCLVKRLECIRHKNKNQTPYGAAHKRFRHTRARFIWKCWYRTAPSIQARRKSIQATPEPPPEVRQAPCQGSKPPLPFRRIATVWQTEAAKEKVSAHSLHCSNIAKGTNVNDFKSYHKLIKIQLQKLHQTSVSNPEENSSKL